jgi:hypothetical protein
VFAFICKYDGIKFLTILIPVLFYCFTYSVPPYNWDYRAVVNPAPVDTCISMRQSVLSHTYMIPNPYVLKLLTFSLNTYDFQLTRIDIAILSHQ